MEIFQLLQTLIQDLLKKYFKKVLVDGQDSIVSDSNIDSLEFVAGDNISLSTDADNDKLTINAVNVQASGWVSDGEVVSLDSNSDKVGIGTDSPADQLTVYSTGIQARFAYDDSNYTTFQTSSSGGLLITPTGNLTLVPGNSLVFSGFDCTGNSNGGVLTANASGVISCSDDDSGSGGGYFTDASGFAYLTDTSDDLVVGGTTLAGADIILGDDGSVIINEQGNDADLRVEGDTNANLMFIDAGADMVGIGTNSPAGRLEVSGEIDTGLDWNLIVRNPYNADATDYGSGLKFKLSSDANSEEQNKWAGIGVVAGTNWAQQTDLVFYGTDAANTTAPSELMRLTGSGNVGIGDNSPASLFTVGNGDLFQVGSDGSVLIDPGSTGTYLDFDLETAWTAGELILADWDSPTPLKPLQ